MGKLRSSEKQANSGAGDRGDAPVPKYSRIAAKRLWTLLPDHSRINANRLEEERQAVERINSVGEIVLEVLT